MQIPVMVHSHVENPAGLQNSTEMSAHATYTSRISSSTSLHIYIYMFRFLSLVLFPWRDESFRVELQVFAVLPVGISF